MDETTKPAALEQFPVVISLPVQWGDQDAFGHVNNTVYFRWFESARIEYLERAGLNCLSPDSDIGPILASINCNYRRQVKFPDTVYIGTRVTRIGRSSMTIAHGLFSQAHGVIAAEGDSAIVIFDYENQRAVRMPDDIRTAIEKLEGKSFS